MSKVQETIQEMARLTMLSNKLNDIQLKNLKTFPFVFFDGLSEVIMDYDLSNSIDVSTEEDKEAVDIEYKVKAHAGHLRVSYYLKLESIIPQTHLDQRFAALENSVRHLLWKDIKVQVFFDGELKFESKK